MGAERGYPEYRKQAYITEAKSRGLSIDGCKEIARYEVPPLTQTEPTAIKTTLSKDTDTNIIPVRVTGDSVSLRERFRKLKEIHDEGLINDKDYKKKKDALLNQL